MVAPINNIEGRGNGVVCADKISCDLQAMFDELRQPEEGTVEYLVCAQWWTNYVVKGLPVVPLDNSKLLDPETKSLKPNLIEGRASDFIFVNKSLWEQILKFSGVLPGSEISRQVIADSDGQTRVELYPLTFQICTCNQDCQFVPDYEHSSSLGGFQGLFTSISFSCKSLLPDIVKDVFTRLKIPLGTECRWWRRSRESAVDVPFQLVSFDQDSLPAELKECPTLDQINVVSGDYIVVEPKKPSEDWPIDSFKMLSNSRTSEDSSVRTEIERSDQSKEILAFDDDWKDPDVIKVDEGTVELPDKDWMQIGSFNPAQGRCQENNSEEPIDMSPLSPDSSSSNGSTSRLKRDLNGNVKSQFRPSSSPFRKTNNLGIKGLQNLGNTCFMASTLQCLNRTMLFTEYFLSMEYVRHLNYQNPLGMKGLLAKEYAKLLNEIWTTSPNRSHNESSIAPFGIKKVISNHAPMFCGYRQHDSQELLAFLLDGLHEDVNRVTDKPYTSSVESEGRSDEIVAQESWKTHLSRNRSIVVDLFQGQLKSTVICPRCERISVTFDPMMYLSLPLTAVGMRTIAVAFIPISPLEAPSLQTVEVSKSGNIGSMVAVISKSVNIPQERISVYEVNALAAVHRKFALIDKLSTIGAADAIFAYEMPRKDATTLHPRFLWVKHVRVACQDGSFSSHRNTDFAYPRPVYITENSTHAELHSSVVKIAAGLCRKGTHLSADDVIIKIVPKTKMCSIPEQVLDPEDGSVWSVPSDVSVDAHVHWSANAFANFYDPSSDLSSHHNSLTGSTEVSLQDCIELFTAEETLSQEDPWYCSSCKEFQQATKKFDLWRLPKILIVHLKRFQYSSYSRSKIDYSVDYPVEGLDLTRFVRGPQRESPVIYDLYAISNHYGGVGGGHYTAYGKCFEDQNWYSFDDSITRPISVDKIKTRNAYVLFYQLRETVDTSV